MSSSASNARSESWVKPIVNVVVACASAAEIPASLNIVLPFDSESGALIYTQNAAGSVFGGDRLRTDLHLEDDVSVCISTPSATRIQGNGLAAQTTHIKLGRGAFIESIPDMIIAHPKAVYRQETHIDLAEGAEAILGESIAPGRVARGEEYVYDAVSRYWSTRRRLGRAKRARR